jgi:hypothetical protein
MICQLAGINHELSNDYHNQIMQVQGIVKDRFQAYQVMAEPQENEHHQAQEEAKKETAELVKKIREIAKKHPEVPSQFTPNVHCNGIIIYINY